MAVLSRIYFENIFCLVPFPKTTNDPSRSELGVKVALGDGGTFVSILQLFSRQLNRKQKTVLIQRRC